MEHPGEIDDAASPVVGTAGNGILSRCFHGAGEIERKLLAVLRKSNPLTWATLDPLALRSSAAWARKAFSPLSAWLGPVCVPIAGIRVPAADRHRQAHPAWLVGWGFSALMRSPA